MEWVIKTKRRRSRFVYSSGVELFSTFAELESEDRSSQAAWTKRIGRIRLAAGTAPAPFLASRLLGNTREDRCFHGRPRTPQAPPSKLLWRKRLFESLPPSMNRNTERFTKVAGIPENSTSIRSVTVVTHRERFLCGCTQDPPTRQLANVRASARQLAVFVSTGLLVDLDTATLEPP
jgi:hypothetical protein